MLITIYPNELKTYVHKTACTSIFIMALLLIAETWKQPRFPSVDKQTKKLQYIYTIEYYSAIKRNELIKTQKKTWRNFKCT